MPDEPTAKTDTGRLRQIARETALEVFNQEIQATISQQITAAVRDAIRGCLNDGTIATTAQVEEVVMEKTKPLQESIEDANRKLTRAREIYEQHAASFMDKGHTLELAAERLTGTITLVQENTRALTQVQAMAEANRRAHERNAESLRELRVDIFGDNTMPENMSLAGLMTERNRQLNESYTQIMNTLVEIKTQFERRIGPLETFMSNRKRIEATAKNVILTAWRWIQAHRWRAIVAAGITSLIIALPDHSPDEWAAAIQVFLEGGAK